MAHTLNFPSYFNEEDEKLQQNMICLMLDDSLTSTTRSSNETSISVNAGFNEEDKRNKNKLAARKARERKRDDKAKIEENYKLLEEKNAKLAKKLKCLKLGIQECTNLIQKFTNKKTDPLDQEMQTDTILEPQQNKSQTIFNIPDSDLFGFSVVEKTSVEATDQPTEVPKFIDQYEPMCSQLDSLDDLDMSCLDMDCINTSDLVTMGFCDPLVLHNQINSDDIINQAFSQVFFTAPANQQQVVDDYSEINLNLDFIYDLSVDDIDGILRYQTS